VQGDARLDGSAFGVVLFFEADTITLASLTLDDPNVIGTSWSDYDPKVALRAHDEWLEARLGNGSEWNPSSFPYGGIEYRYVWGAIGSFLQPQDQTASLTVSYRRA
jgi:hypothetical protein